MDTKLVGHQEICGTRRESDRRARDPELGLRATSEYKKLSIDDYIHLVDSRMLYL